MVQIFLLISLMFSAAYAETRSKIVVIDTGVSLYQSQQTYMCENGVRSALGDNGLDDHYTQHGTNVVGLIAKKMNRKKYCIISIKFYGKVKMTGQQALNSLLISLDITKDINPAFLNLSLNGPVSDIQEYIKIMSLLRKGVTIVVAAGNDQLKLTKDNCGAYPACYKYTIPAHLSKNYKVVGAYDITSSNTGDIVDAYMTGRKVGYPVLSGTSQAAAIYTSQITSP